jgi:APA family basic amino acid/polyamine antiporter
VLFAAIFCGSIAAMAAGLWNFQLSTLTGVDFGATVLFGGVTAAQAGAIALILVLTAVNAAGADVSGRLQAVLTCASVGIVMALAAYALARGAAPAVVAPAAAPTAGGLAVAYMGVYFAYSGWNNVSYVAGEVRDPARILPRALLGGVVAITALYVLMLLGFVGVLGLDGVGATGDAGTAAAERLGGPAAQLVLAAIVAAAIVAAINASVCAGARIVWAMARDGSFWGGAGTLGRSGAPSRALWLQAACSAALVLSGSFDQLVSLSSLAMILIGALTVGALYVLRWREPDAPRPYRATGYPWLPALFPISGALAAAAMVRNALAGEEGAWYPLLGMGVLLVAWGLRAIAGRGAAT